MEYKLVSDQISDEIELKLQAIRKAKRLDLPAIKLAEGMEMTLEQEALSHSCRIEEDSENTATLYESIPRGDYRGNNSHNRKTRGCIHDLKRALTWGKSNFDLGTLDENFIKQLAARIDISLIQGEKPEAVYRSEASHSKMVRAGNASWTPPYPEKIQDEMDSYMSQLHFYLDLSGKVPDISRVLHAVGFSHLHLIRIHPFPDGNGRTARMFQNIILSQYGLPAPVIYAGERLDYYEHLNKAIIDWRARTSGTRDRKLLSASNERGFYNYITGKVSASLDRVIDKIEEARNQH